MKTNPRRGTIGILLKRFPRLSETFILNEIRGLERLGMDLEIMSLLRPEEDLVHASVSEVQAPVTYFEAALVARVIAVVRAHAEVFVALPGRYISALALAAWWALRGPLPFKTMTQFWRAGFVAATCRRAGIVHLHAHFANQPATVAAIVSAMIGIPYSITAHAKDLYLQPASSLRRRSSGASFIATCTRHNVEYLRRNLPTRSASKIHLVYHGIDVKAFAAVADSRHCDDGPPVILSVGRLVPKKGMSYLIASCAELRDRDIAFSCTIVGSGPLEAALREQIERAGLQDRVRLVGAMTHEKLVALYRTAAVFALAPHILEDGDRDGIPNVLVEAMAAGVPVVSTDVSGIPELIEHERTGLLVPPCQPRALAAALARVLADPLSAELRASEAARFVRGDFECWKNVRAFARLLGWDERPSLQHGLERPPADSFVPEACTEIGSSA